jgi:hypothetical protein
LSAARRPDQGPQPNPCSTAAPGSHDRRDGAKPEEESLMSKGMDAKKTEMKKPAKSLKEKRAAKQEKRKQS